MVESCLLIVTDKHAQITMWLKDIFISRGVNKMPLKKQLFGYNKEQVDDLMDQKDQEIKSLNEQINKLKEDYEHLENKSHYTASCEHPRTNK